jgi:hypothetical protein
MYSGSLPSTKYGLYPYPLKGFQARSFLSLQALVGLAILYPFKWSMGQHAHRPFSDSKIYWNATRWLKAPFPLLRPPPQPLLSGWVIVRGAVCMRRLYQALPLRVWSPAFQAYNGFLCRPGKKNA